jgi:hypothetical protein
MKNYLPKADDVRTTVFSEDSESDGDSAAHADGREWVLDPESHEQRLKFIEERLFREI